MIYLTGDVHNFLGPQLDEMHCGVHEASAALRCAQYAADAGVQVNFFVTGRAVAEATEQFLAIKALGNVEFGGHGWDAFRNHVTRSLLWCVFGSRYGPASLQRHDIMKTIRVFRHRLGVDLKTWRGHGYYADANTYCLLLRAGIQVVSDHVSEDMHIGQILPGLWAVPINTMPDHDSIPHGPIDQIVVEKSAAVLRAIRDLRLDSVLSAKQKITVLARRLLRRGWDIPVLGHSGERMYADRPVELIEPAVWEARLYQDIERRLRGVGFATLLVHPVCMAALDDLATFRRIVMFCRSVGTGFLSEAPLPSLLSMEQSGLRGGVVPHS